MDTAVQVPATARYAQCIEASKRVRWDIDRDVVRGRSLDFQRKFLPDRLARIDGFRFATPAEKRFVSHIQGRTYANMFALVERFIGSKLVEIARPHALRDQVVFESLVRFTDEELKHQQLFERLEAMMESAMPKGYLFVGEPAEVAEVVLRRSTWAVLGLTCNIELFTLDHYRQSIDKDPEVSELWKDVFLFHMKEEAQHAVLDEMEWLRENARLGPAQRDAAVDDLIALVAAVDALLQAQARADTHYFLSSCGRVLGMDEQEAVEIGFRRAYRWQYIASGVKNERFMAILGDMVTPEQLKRVVAAMAPILDDAGALQ